MRSWLKLTFLLGAAAVLVVGVAVVQQTDLSSLFGERPVRLYVDAKPPKKLASYGLFQGEPVKQKPVKGLTPYDINTPLFSDYASKKRFVWVPDGKKIAYNDSVAFDFPVGAALVKTFYYPHEAGNPEAGRRLIETRLLVREQDGWDARAYVWNKEQTEATLDITGANPTVHWTDRQGEARTVHYHVPNKNECRGCHVKGDQITPIGPKARNLNKPYPYPRGPAENQLTHWSQAGLLAGAPAAPDDAPRNAVWNDPSTGTLAERARAYLEINCQHCHNAKGPASTTGFFLGVRQTDPSVLGFYKSPVAAGQGSGTFRYVIHPGHPGTSILIHRLRSTEPDAMMPEMGRSTVHKEGVALLSRWIASLDTTQYAALAQ